MAYIFYKSYSKLEISANKTNQEENIVVDLINTNSDKIEKLNGLIKDINNNLININSIFNSKENDNEEINDEIIAIFDDIKNEINILKLDILSVQKEVKNKKVSKENLKDNSLRVKYNNEVIQLIKIKFEDGKNISKEIDLLNQMGGTKIQPLIEILYLLNNRKFKGNEMLYLEFQNETNNYISKIFFSNNMMIKSFMPFINIQPSEINALENKALINIKNVNELIIKKQYDKSIMLLKSIDDENKYFNTTLEQLHIGKKFYTTIEEIVNNG